ncbi:acetate/propionate family kinase [Hansschlegelia sp.]|uniref:acetate/propionate family kinase n=1 Tax=Hansschlegelia sp. TaxID=2041892 RepID=UPI002C470E73|nr:acetate/propionate family kinase [Hansschlegelia sp.]HVI29371.1 acetate/propionate family kinase [Hansschlegelia sp.]
MTDAILTLNAGSSSVKFAVFEAREARLAEVLARGRIERVGSRPRLVVRDAANAVLHDRTWPEGERPRFDELIDAALAWCETRLGGRSPAALGHRVVHGGPNRREPAIVTPELLRELEALRPLAPLHEPHNLDPIHAISASRPELRQVACFDTAFHHTMPATATRLAIPRAYEAKGVRRYGFHGLSYEYLAGALRTIDPVLAEGRVIAAHLGSGASLCALRAGLSVETTMGFTALDGLVMGTRCGTLDPGVVLYLLQQEGLSAQEVQELLYKRSGLLGVSGGLSSDMRDLLESPHPGAREAVETFVYRFVREAGALVSCLGGLDGLVFTAGVGENAPAIRRMTCAGLAWLGVEIDYAANKEGRDLISTPGSKVKVRIIPTDEERMIARHTLALLAAPGDVGQSD